MIAALFTRVRALNLDWVAAFVLFVLALGVYAATAAPGLLDADEGEFQVNIHRLGVSHTGYPTFFLLGKLWTILLPIGTVATRTNLFSAFWGAVTIGALYLFVHFLTRNRWAAAICALLLTVSRVEWSQAVIPRPYTMNSLFVVVVAFLFFLWRIGKVDLTVPVFAVGLSLTNHRTMMWFGPAIALFVLWHERAALCKPRRLLGLAVAFVLPLLLYSYVWWRGESDVGVEFHWKDFNDEIMGGYVRASWRFGPVDWLISRVTDLYIPMLIEQFTVFGFAAGLVGMVALMLGRAPAKWPASLPPRQVFWFILLANLANTAFCVIFWVIDIDKFFLPSFITFLFFTGVGIALVWERLASLRFSAGLRVGMLLAFAGATGFLLQRNWPLNNWSHRTDIARAWEENLAQPLEQNAIIAGSWESITPLEYAMYVDGRRLDLERWKLIIKNYQLGQVPYDSRREDIEKAVRSGRPVYMTTHPGETETLDMLDDEYRLTRVGELWRIVNLSPDDARLDELKSAAPLQTFTDQEGRALELLGYSLHPTGPLRAGDFVLASLYWRVPHSFSEHLSVSFRLIDANNNQISQRDSEPGSGLRPTNGWLPNEIVRDDIGLLLPPDAPPGNYRLAVVVYNLATGENLRTRDGLSFELDKLSVGRADRPVPVTILPISRRLDAALPPLRLLGYALDHASPKGGDTVNLSLWWQRDRLAGRADRIDVSLRDAAGGTVSLYSGAPIPGLDAAEWGEDLVLRGRYSVALPIDLLGTVRLVIQAGESTVELPSFDVRPSGRTFVLPRISHPQTAQIGDSIKLLGYDLDKTRVRPGESVRLTLYWQALSRPAQSLTVFAHALDEGGVLRGQKDAPPRGGELPTDRWLPGEVVTDAYDIVIAPDAPDGTYRFEVGMYVLETGVRVPATDANGVRLEQDRIMIDKVQVQSR